MSKVIEKPNREKTKTKEFEEAIEEIGNEPFVQFNFRVPVSLADKFKLYTLKKKISYTQWFNHQLKSIKID